MNLTLKHKFIMLGLAGVSAMLLNIYLSHIVHVKDETIMVVLECISLSLAVFVSAFAIFGVFAPQEKIIASMTQLAQGHNDADIPHTERSDEIGEMARALRVFKENAQQVVSMAAEHKRQESEAREQKKKSLQDLADNFEANVKHVVDMVASAATEMDATSQSVAKMAESSQEKLGVLTEKIASTTQNVQTVADSSTQLSAAINEINEQVARSSMIAATAVDEACKADGTVQLLSEAANKIGEVVEMINTIAAQINLLALNATIEAARAGDAGKGFAVVASEVKNLATQTTKATEQIAQYISSIQGATGQTVAVIKHIGGTIREINEISTTIAAAVEQQGAATRDISSNVQQAARSTEEVSGNAADVLRTSKETGESANQMMDATSELSRQSETLRHEVDKFLSGVRTG